MNRVLLVEDSLTQAAVLKSFLERQTPFVVDVAVSFAAAKQQIESASEPYLAALLDLYLPDVEPLDLVNHVVESQVPPIVFTGEYRDDIQDMIWSCPIVDYVIKGSHSSLEYLAELLIRLERNQGVKVLVVDDSRVARGLMSRLLKVHRYQVLEAESGARALEAVEANPELCLVVTDYQMPEMDGFELVSKIRERYSRRNLAIIGVSAEGSTKFSARFIKAGANDFIKKPFSSDEFYCRVMQNVAMVEHIREMRETAITDPLTALRNRRYFFEMAQLHFARAKRNRESFAVAMLDIDHFKRVNDQYGHDAGDETLRQVARILKQRFRESDIVCRLGGEEFGVAMPDMSDAECFRVLDIFRKTLAETPIPLRGREINVTISMGVCCEMSDSLESMLKTADKRLYTAKDSGRNRVVCS